MWRQTRLIFDGVKHSLIKGVRMLGTCLRNWDDIIYKLSEPPRKRILQIPRLSQAPAAPG